VSALFLWGLKFGAFGADEIPANIGGYVYMTTKLRKKALGLRRGQTSVEYILIIAVIVGVIFAFGKQFKTQIEKVTNELFGGVSTNIKSLTGGGQ